MRDTYDADEVAVIEDKAYQVGVGIGEMNERKRIIALLVGEYGCDCRFDDCFAHNLIALIKGEN